jgi:hypothetical protein
MMRNVFKLSQMTMMMQLTITMKKEVTATVLMKL